MTTYLHPMRAILLTACTLLACTDDAATTTSDGTDREPPGTDPDREPPEDDAETSAGQPDPLEPPPADVTETEGRSATVEPGQSFSGVAVAGEEDDSFTVTLAAGDVLEVQLTQAIGAPIPLTVGFLPEDRAVWNETFRSVQFETGATGTHWQFFVPFDGRYELAIRQNAYNVTASGDTAYAFDTRLVELSPMMESSSGDFRVDLDGALTVRAAGYESSTPIEARVYELDDEQYSFPRLRFWDPSAKALVPVFERFREGETQISFRAQPTTYWLIADADNARSGDSFSISYGTADDAAGVPTDLVVAAPTLTGALTMGDVDYYRVRLSPGEIVRAEVLAPRELEATIDVLAYADGETTLAAHAVEGVTAVEFPALTYGDSTAEHLLEIRTPLGVEGDYSIRLTAAAWTPEPLAPEPSTDEECLLGGYRWHGGELQASTLIVVRGLETGKANLRIDAWDGRFREELSYPSAIYLPLAESYQIGFRDAYFQGGSAFGIDATVQTVDVGAMTFPTRVEDSSSATGLQLDGLPIEVSGSADEEIDRYVVPTQAGRLYVALLQSVDPASTDGSTFDWTADPTLLGGVWRSTTGQVLSHEATVAGSFTFGVTGDCTDDDRGRQCERSDYALRVLAVE